jgi:hypothetical protein
MVWKPVASHGGLVGLAAIAAILGLDVVSFLLFQRIPISVWSFILTLIIAVSIPAMVAIAYWLFGFYTLSYGLDRDALTVTWGVTQRVVPLASIHEIKIGVELEGEAVLRWLHWPGYQVGMGTLSDLGPTQFYVTAPRHSQVILVTPEHALALSPADRSGFLNDLEAHRQIGPSQDVVATLRQPELFRLSAWQDRAAQAWIAAAVIANLALFAFIALRFPNLPDLLPLHFDATGMPDRIGSRIELFRLPLIGLLVLVVNNGLALLLHRREPLATYLLLASAFAAQLLLAVAIYQIVQ